MSSAIYLYMSSLIAKDGQHIADKILNEQIRQIESLTNLSTGICGGIVALLIQIYLNKKSNNLSRIYLLKFTFLTESLSLLLGYMAHGSLIAFMPSFYSHSGSFVFIKNFTQDADFDGYTLIKETAKFQFILFFLGFILMLFFIAANIKLINGEYDDHKKIIQISNHSNKLDHFLRLPKFLRANYFNPHRKKYRQSDSQQKNTKTKN